MIVVVSTGLNAPTKQRCLRSVREQTLPAEHRYVEAGDQATPAGALQNRAEVVAHLDPQDVVVALDGDDWLAHPNVLSVVSRLYDDHECWLTYGSFRYADGRPGFAAPVTWPPRRNEWTSSHLMTFRAGLFQRLDDKDLRYPDGTWRKLAGDQAMMLPMLELAGAERSRFVPEVLCVYNYATSFEHTAGADGLAAERQAAAEIRALTPRDRLVSL